MALYFKYDILLEDKDEFVVQPCPTIFTTWEECQSDCFSATCKVIYSSRKLGTRTLGINHISREINLSR